MQSRHPNSICMLCNKQAADKKGSHMMPNFLLKYIIGDRNYEAAYTINAMITKIRTFFGSANIKNTDTSYRKNEHVMDHLFCKSCESWMGIIEAETSEFLNKKVRGKQYHQQYTQCNIGTEMILKKSVSKKKSSIHLCIYTIIYRILLKYRFSWGLDAIHPNTVSSIREFIAPFIGYSIKELEKEDVVTPFEYTIFTNETLDYGYPLYGYSYYKPTNPEVFLMGRYIVLLHHKELCESVPLLPVELCNGQLSNGLAEEYKTVFLSNKLWDDFLKKTT